LEKTLDAETTHLLGITDSEVEAKLLTFTGNRDLEDCTELGKLFTIDDDEKQARAAKLDWDILKTTFSFIGGSALIATFVFTDFLSRLVSTFSGFYEKDFFVQDEE
jgi:ATP-binding cassette, subfamily C (CFTR/MRP), member 1